MPLPTPHDGESHDAFMARCMHDADLPTAGDQRLAACFSQWRRKKLAEADALLMNRFVDEMNREDPRG